MKEINIAKVLVYKRKEKGITQDELANYHEASASQRPGQPVYFRRAGIYCSKKL